MVIYSIRHIATLQEYIGQTTVHPEEHWKLYRRALNGDYFHNSHLQNAWNKYGEDAFEFVIVDRTAINQTQLNVLEEQYISARGHYNFKIGGGAHGTHSEDTKLKISKNNVRYWKGKFRPDLSEKFKGHKVTNKTRQKISKKLKGRPLSEKTKQKMKNRIPWNKGKKGFQVAWNKGMNKNQMLQHRGQK